MHTHTHTQTSFLYLKDHKLLFDMKHEVNAKYAANNFCSEWPKSRKVFEFV